MVSENPMVALVGVNKGFVKGKETITIFDHLDLAIPRGDFVAVMGPSGSGKTTLLNLLGGIDRADGGEIRIADSRIDRMSEGQLASWRAANIGFIFQFYNLMPMLTAAQNVELPLLLTELVAQKERARARADRAAVVGLADRVKHNPREMSGGQQQRVAIARAIVSDPNLLLCDEPTGDLDRALRRRDSPILQAAQQRSRQDHRDGHARSRGGALCAAHAASRQGPVRRTGARGVNDFDLVRKNLFRTQTARDTDDRIDPDRVHDLRRARRILPRLHAPARIAPPPTGSSPSTRSTSPSRCRSPISTACARWRAYGR